MTQVAAKQRSAADALTLRVCPECGYSLQGLSVEGVCPECGEPYDQRYIVLFGQTPEGSSRRASWTVFLILLACGAVVTYMSIRDGTLLSRSSFLVLSMLAIYVVLWITRRLSLKKDIHFQVWLNERGFAILRPRSETSWLSHVERALQFCWPIILAFTLTDSSKPLTVASAIFVLVFVLLLIGMMAVLSAPPRMRNVGTGEARPSTLTRWDRSDQLEIRPAGDGIAHLRIQSCSYLGAWKWNAWYPIDATVRLSADQLPALRDCLNRWIAAGGCVSPSPSGTEPG